MRRILAVGIVAIGAIVVATMAQGPSIPPCTETTPTAALSNCSLWTLDGYSVGMGASDLLSVRPATSYVEGQCQAVVAGKLHGALVLDSGGRLQKWDVQYDAVTGDDVREALTARFGCPVSETVTHSSSDRATDVVEKKTMWLSAACDAAIVVDEYVGHVQGVPTRRVGALLVRASTLEDGPKLKASKFE